MKTKNRIATLVIPALLLGQAAASAATSEKALEACTGAIAGHFEGLQGVKPNTRVESIGTNDSRRLISFTVFELDAVDPATQAVVGRFSCMVNERARVRRLVTLPLTAPDASERGRG